MACGGDVQCSGDTVIRTDNGIALMASGVEVLGRSTSDLATPITDTTSANGLALTSSGSAEVRVKKQTDGTTTAVALLLKSMGLTWDAVNERPTIIETFNPTQGRVTLNADNTLTFSALPDSADLNFYDYATKGRNATQADYANNRYFPRSTPSRCPAGTSSPCPTTETPGIQSEAGDWHSGGANPDTATSYRFHEDGDVHAGNAASGNPPVLPGGSGIGAPYPGSKGYRTYASWSFSSANLAEWMTQDTVEIAEWSTTGVEHNTNRRGFVAFGNVTDPNSVPASGTATYTGIAHGRYVAAASDDPQPFTATVTIAVDFATRQVSVALQNPVSGSTNTAIPIAFTANTILGAAGQSLANYLNGPVQSGALSGGLSGRFFGTAGASGIPEMGGAFSLSSATGQTALGGFIARKQ